MADKTFYCVTKGGQTGIYLSNWYVRKQTDKFPRALHQRFKDLDESMEFMKKHTSSPEDEWHVYEGNGFLLAQHMDMLAGQGDEMIPVSEVVISPVFTFCCQKTK